MLIKHLADHLVIHSPMCGEIREILTQSDYKPLGIALALDIQPTQAHYHRTFDEIYFVLDGQISVESFDPQDGTVRISELGSNELLVIKKGVHHRILSASERNRLCVITSPPFCREDELASDRLGEALAVPIGN